MSSQNVEHVEDAAKHELVRSAEWQALLGHFDYGEGFAFGLLLVPGKVISEICRSALADHLTLSAKHLLDLSPSSPEELKQITGALLQAQVEDSVGAVWVAAVVSDFEKDWPEWEAAWREGFARLNQFRNTLQRKLGCTLVVVGTPPVQPIIRNMAPDLWSVRSWAIQLSPLTPRSREERELQPRPETVEKGIGPDPYFALQQAELLRGKPDQELTLADVLERAGEGFLIRGKYQQAEHVLLEVLHLRRQLLGEDHLDTIGAMNNLAYSLRELGDYAGARRLQEQVLELRRRILGNEHPNTISAMNNLAISLDNQGDYAGARGLQEQVMEMSRRLFGEEHPHTIGAMENLAITLGDQRELVDARGLIERVLELRHNLLGEEHPHTIRAMGNLANTLADQEDFAGSRQLGEQVLELKRRILGNEHPDTVTAMNNLAGTLYQQGDFAGARRLQEQVMEQRRRILGAEHPYTISAMKNLLYTLNALGDSDEARRLQEQLDTLQDKSRSSE